MNKVQKKNKNKKIVPFWAFAFELQKKLNKEGKQISDSAQLQKIAGTQWAQLSAEEREKYKNRAKDPAVALPSKNRIIYNSLGQDVAEVEARAAQERNSIKEMVAEVKQLINDAYSVGALDEAVFYFINATAFIEVGEDIFPAELAMAKFSLKKGIEDNFHIRINPGELPMGATNDAKEHSLKYHKYPLPPDCEGEKDYLAVLEKMIKFLHPMEKLPIFFTEGNFRDNQQPFRITRKTVKKILYESQEDDLIDKIKIYPIEELFYNLQRLTAADKANDDKTATKFLSVVYAQSKLKEDTYEYTTAGCPFHKVVDTSFHCCLSKVRRYGYTIARWCCNKTKYPLIKGAHFPEDYDNV